MENHRQAQVVGNGTNITHANRAQQRSTNAPAMSEGNQSTSGRPNYQQSQFVGSVGSAQPASAHQHNDHAGSRAFQAGEGYMSFPKTSASWSGNSHAGPTIYTNIYQYGGYAQYQDMAKNTGFHPYNDPALYHAPGAQPYRFGPVGLYGGARAGSGTVPQASNSINANQPDVHRSRQPQNGSNGQVSHHTTQHQHSSRSAPVMNSRLNLVNLTQPSGFSTQTSPSYAAAMVALYDMKAFEHGQTQHATAPTMYFDPLFTNLSAVDYQFVGGAAGQPDAVGFDVQPQQQQSHFGLDSVTQSSYAMPGSYDHQNNNLATNGHARKRARDNHEPPQPFHVPRHRLKKFKPLNDQAAAKIKTQEELDALQAELVEEEVPNKRLDKDLEKRLVVKLNDDEFILGVKFPSKSQLRPLLPGEQSESSLDRIVNGENRHYLEDGKLARGRAEHVQWGITRDQTLLETLGAFGHENHRDLYHTRNEKVETAVRNTEESRAAKELTKTKWDEATYKYVHNNLSNALRAATKTFLKNKDAKSKRAAEAERAGRQPHKQWDPYGKFRHFLTANEQVEHDALALAGNWKPKGPFYFAHSDPIRPVTSSTQATSQCITAATTLASGPASYSVGSERPKLAARRSSRLRAGTPHPASSIETTAAQGISAYADASALYSSDFPDGYPPAIDDVSSSLLENVTEIATNRSTSVEGSDPVTPNNDHQLAPPADCTSATYEVHEENENDKEGRHQPLADHSFSANSSQSGTRESLQNGQTLSSIEQTPLVRTGADAKPTPTISSIDLDADQPDRPEKDERQQLINTNDDKSDLSPSLTEWLDEYFSEHGHDNMV